LPYQAPLSGHDVSASSGLSELIQLSVFPFHPRGPDKGHTGTGTRTRTRLFLAGALQSVLSSSPVPVSFGDRPGSHRLSRRRGYDLPPALRHSTWRILLFAHARRRFITLTVLASPRSRHRGLSLMHCRPLVRNARTHADPRGFRREISSRAAHVRARGEIQSARTRVKRE